MFLEFKTERNKNGHYKYLCIDTVNNVFSRFNGHIAAPDAIVIKSSDYNYMIDTLTAAGFTENANAII